MRTQRIDSQQNGKRITLKEIARLTGVSVSTVSLVLSGKASEARISDQVKEKVRRVAADQDWTPNLLVRSLQSGRTNVLSFYNSFRDRLVGDLYMDHLSAAVELEAGTRGYNLLVHCDARRGPEEVYRALKGGLSDGVLFFGPLDGQEDLLVRLRQGNLPVVLVDREDPEGKLSSVSDDGEAGIRLVAERLVAAGHRRIGAINGSPRSDGPTRIAALRRELVRLGVELPEKNVVAVYSTHRTACEALEIFQRDAHPPTALFCWHDRVGYEVLEACLEMGIAIPDELSLVGYDGIEWPTVSRHVLASVAVPLEEIAKRAVGLLTDLATGLTSGPVFERHAVSFVEGTTLARPHSSH